MLQSSRRLRVCDQDPLPDSVRERERRHYDDFVKRHGSSFADGILAKLTYDADFEHWLRKPKSETSPRKILAELYPGVDSTKPFYAIDIASEAWGFQGEILDALSWHPSERIDRVRTISSSGWAAASSIRRKTISLPWPVSGGWAERATTRKLESYLSRRIPLISREWEADPLKAALATLRGETFSWSLRNEEVTDANVADLTP